MAVKSYKIRYSVEIYEVSHVGNEQYVSTRWEDRSNSGILVRLLRKSLCKDLHRYQLVDCNNPGLVSSVDAVESGNVMTKRKPMYRTILIFRTFCMGIRHENDGFDTWWTSSLFS